MAALSVHVGEKVQIKRKKSYEAPHLAEHAGKVGRVTKVVTGHGPYVIHLEPTRLGLTATGVVRGRNSEGLRLIVGHDDIQHVKEK
jgi:hypothetical protein